MFSYSFSFSIFGGFTFFWGGTSHWNGWFRGTPILGNLHIGIYWRTSCHLDIDGERCPEAPKRLGGTAREGDSQPLPAAQGMARIQPRYGNLQKKQNLPIWPNIMLTLLFYFCWVFVVLVIIWKRCQHWTLTTPLVVFAPKEYNLMWSRSGEGPN